MNSMIGKKVLVTTEKWFYAPDGKQYNAVYGTLNSVNEAGKALGFIPNRSHANWYYDISGMIIMGCQVMYVVPCDEAPYMGEVEAWNSNDNGLITYTKPTCIYAPEL